MMNFLSFVRILHDFRQHDRWTRPQLEAYQNQAFQRLRQYAYAHSPFYQQFHRNLFDKSLHELPVLTKAMVMEHFDDLLSDRSLHLADIESHLANQHDVTWYRGSYRVCVTGGTSGGRGVFLFNRPEWNRLLASYARAYEWAGHRINLTRRMRLATITSPKPWHLSAAVRNDLETWWTPALRLAASDPIERMVERLNSWQPEVLVCFASIAQLLGHEQLTGRLQIAPRFVFTSAEVMTPDRRHTIEGAWGKRLFDQYGASEGGNHAAECTHHTGMHLMEDGAIFEVVDGDNRPVPAGEVGEKLLVTLLFSRTQPLIRYELSDRLRLSAATCPCGRPYRLVEEIEGRIEEILYYPDAAGRQVLIHPNVFHQIMDIVPSGQWQVVGERDCVRIRLSGAPADFVTKTLAEAVRQALKSRGVIGVPVQVERVSHIPRSPVGKVVLIKRDGL